MITPEGVKPFPATGYRTMLEERDQPVGRLERAAPQMRWNDRFHGVKLLCRIATRVDFSGRQSGVPQPQRHLTDVLRCLQDDHRARVPEHVGRDAFLVEAGMPSSGGRR